LPSVVQRNPFFAIAAKGLLKERVERPHQFVPLDRDDRPKHQGVGALIVNRGFERDKEAQPDVVLLLHRSK
jgi:hypothetical protein